MAERTRTQMMRERTAFLSLAVLVVLVVVQQAVAQPSTSSVELRVYDDGTVAVTQVLSVPSNDTSVSVQLLSSLIANPVVTDQNGSSLYFQITGENVTVYTIGATGVTLAYDTAALTSKQGTVWTLAFQALYNTTVTLPDGSTLTSVSGTPNSIGTADGSPVVVVSKGDWTMDYGVPVQVVSSSTSSASSTSTGATVTSTTTSSTSSTSSISSISSAASPSLAVSTYTTLGTSSGSTGRTGQGQSPTSGSSGTAVYLAVAVIVVLVVAGLLLLVRQRRGVPLDPKNSELRPDDIKVIEFISEKGGKVLEPEIRMRFALPKTSAWRQIKRLERLGYVKVTKIGSQNQVELVKGRPGGQAA
jgi:uncharacterized membrane protein